MKNSSFFISVFSLGLKMFVCYRQISNCINLKQFCINYKDYEDIIYLDLEFDWWYQRLYFGNIEMINQSDFIIFYIANAQNSGVYKAMKYAQKIKKIF